MSYRLTPMYFYKYFIMTFVTLHLQITASIENKELVIQNKGLETVTPCGVGLVLFADVNNTSNEDFEVEVAPDECCVEVGSDEDCELVEIVGDCAETVDRGTLKRLKLVAPLIDPFERHGYCILYLDSKPKNRQRGTLRDTIEIPFDTRIKYSKQAMKLPDNITACNKIDEDPLNNCKPVDCESFYNGKRSYFDKKDKRCVEIPSCVSKNADDDVPDVIYDFTKNKCRVGKSVTNSDMNLIKDLTGGRHRKTKDILIIKNLNKTPATDAMALYDLKNITNKISETENNDYMLQLDKHKLDKIKKKSLRFIMAKYFIANRSTVLVFGGIILVQCCLICTMIYCMGKQCACKKKKLIRKFFNYRQDASVTTPLICTSNIDTETTEFQYLSESSNIDKKIKCYKACQKERKNNMKMSMSDDILSKCLTRRDWSSKPAKSEAIPEITLAEDNVRDTIETLNESNYQANVSSQSRKASNAKVNFEKEKQRPKKEKKQDKMVKSIVKKIQYDHHYEDDINCEMSEKEIKCHSYNDIETRSNVTGFKPNSQTKKLGLFKTDKSKKGTVSISTEKGAQAEFSNDSIDDFLSERGLIFLAGEDLSKYSFSSRSNEAKSSSLSSEVSSKTSKNNNMVKNVLSLLHRRSKHGPASDPGVKKSSNMDIELIHMSKASVYSSNNESDYLKSLKVTKDSRSSL